MSLLKKLAGQTAIYGLSSMVGRLLNYFLVPLYTGVLDPATYGVSSWFYAFASFAAVIFTYGMETAFFRFSSSNNSDSSEIEEDNRTFATIFISILVSSIAFSLLIFLFAAPLAHATGNEGRAEFFKYFAFILGADAITAIPFARLRQQRKPTRFAMLRLLSIGINICLNVWWYLIEKRTDIAPMFWANILSSVLVLPFFYQDFKNIRYGFDAQLWKKMFFYAFPLIFMGFAGMINETLDRMLLKVLIADQLVAETQTGIYNANYKLSLLVTLFIQAFRMGAEPFFFARAKSDGAAETYAKVMRIFVAVCALLFVMVMVYLDFFKFFIGKKYWSGLKVVPILLMANICLGMYYNLSVWYKLTDKTRLGAWVSVAGAGVTLFFNWLWIPTLGYLGSAWATLICYAFMAVTSWFLGQRFYPVPYPIGRIFAYLALALGIWQAFEWLKNTIFTVEIGKEGAQTVGILGGGLFAVSTACFLLFAGILWFMEKNTIRNTK